MELRIEECKSQMYLLLKAYLNPSRIEGPASTSPLVDTMTGSTTKAAFKRSTESTQKTDTKTKTGKQQNGIPRTGNRLRL